MAKHQFEKMTNKEKKTFLDSLMKNGFDNTPFDDLTTEQQAIDAVCVAMDDDDEDKAYELIDFALSLDPTCELAYEALGDFSDNMHVSGACYKMGADIGLSKYLDMSKEEEKNSRKQKSVQVGMFYNMFETRSTIRCLYKYGDTLFTDEQYLLAKQIFEKIMYLNSSDNMGSRYVLMHIYLALEDDKSFKKILKKYNDSTSYFMYAKALHGYIYKKDDAKVLSRLKKEALAANAFIPALLRDGSDCEFLPNTYRIGSTEEADIYEDMYGDLWKKTEGAIAWLCKN